MDWIRFPTAAEWFTTTPKPNRLRVLMGTKDSSPLVNGWGLKQITYHQTARKMRANVKLNFHNPLSLYSVVFLTFHLWLMERWTGLYSLRGRNLFPATTSNRGCSLEGYWGLTRPEHKVNLSHSPTTKVSNGWSLVSMPQMCHNGWIFDGLTTLFKYANGNFKV